MRTMEAVQSPMRIGVGDEVIRRTEPRTQKRDEPLVGVVQEIRGDRARVRWTGAVRYGASRRGDNTTSVKLSGLLEATEENRERARQKLRGKRDGHLEMRAEIYEEQAEKQEARGEHVAAEWSRAEAARFRRAMRGAA